ncbi:MAG: DEAD/DEAH box helicase family protein [Balneolales bacterium]|nr:DEAD/DEAH box helicase family protein [Balneolales bacterium]
MRGIVHFRENFDKSASTALQTRQKRFEKISSLYLKAKAAGKIKTDLIPVIDNLFEELGNELEISFAELSKTVDIPEPNLPKPKSDEENQKKPKLDTGRSPEKSRSSDEENAEEESTAKQGRKRDGLDKPSERPGTRPAHDRTGRRGRVNYSLRNKLPLKLTKRQRHKLNQDAIELLNSSKSLSDEELDILRQYTGYGGLQVDSAGVLNQHYTSYTVIKFVWDKLEKMGVNSGWFLEPGCGVGNWAGLKPNENINLVMFDYDQVAVSIAEKLYPQESIFHADIKEFDFGLHSKYITGAVGNVPFGNYRRYAKNDRFASLKPLIHDSFILKTVEAVQPGGVIALISSAGTMNKKDTRIREAVVEMAHFLGAYRLPNTAFKDNASTVVTTDILFFQKRNAVKELSQLDNQFVEVYEIEEGISNSVYYKNHPENVLGTTEIGAGQFARRIGVTGELNDDLLASKIQLSDIKLSEQFPGKLQQPDLAKKSVKLSPIVLAANSVLTNLKTLVNLQQEKADIAAKTAQRKNLKAKIDAFVKTYGYPEEKKVKTELLKYFSRNSDFYQLITLVKKGSKGSVYSQIVEQDTVFSAEYEPRAASTRITDILLFARQSGYLTDAETLAKVTDSSIEAIRKKADADPDVFFNPESNVYELRFEYLQGNIYEKLDKAKAANLSKNEAALRQVLPTPKNFDEISVDITAINSYLPIEYGQMYVKYLLGGALVGAPRGWRILEASDSGNELYSVGWRPHDKELEDYINLNDYPARPVSRKSFTSNDAYKEALSHSRRMKLKNNAKMRRLMPKRFKAWITDVAPDDVREDVLYRWNRAFNNVNMPEFTGNTFTMAEMASTWTNGMPFKPKKHQKAFVERALYTGSMVNAHGVGAGKTLTSIMLTQALKQRGLAKKTLVVSPSKVIEKWIAEYHAAFPSARLLNLKTSKAQKEEYLSLAQQNEYDAVFITHEGFSAIPVSPAVESKYIQKRLDFIDKRIKSFESQFSSEEIEVAKKLSVDSKADVPRDLKMNVRYLKEAYIQRLNMQNKLEIAMEAKKLDSIYFDDIGFDALIIDEAHNFKNLYMSPKAAQLGIGVATSSNRAEELFMKTDWLNQRTGERNIYLLTATPTNNSPLEAYIFLQMIAPTLLEREMKVETVDDFIDLFALIETKTVFTVSQNYENRQIVTGYKDLSTLRKLFNRYFEYLDLAEAGEVVRPKMVTEPVIVSESKMDELIRLDLISRAESIRKSSSMGVGPKLPSGANDDYQILATTGRRGAIDPALYIFPELGGVKLDTGKILPESKTGRMLLNVYKNYWKTPRNVTAADGVVTKNALNGQLIFSDPVTTTKKNNFHKMMRDYLVDLGIPASEIAIINGQENSKPDDKKRIQDAFNTLEIRVIIGNTSSMGEGMDLNRYCTHIHHLDIPWKPSDLVQRNGRGHRQGNVNAEIKAVVYLLKKSMDIYMNNMLETKIRWFNELWRGSSDYLDNLDEDGVGMDYEDIRMQLEEDVNIVKTLSMSKQVKEYLEELETTAEDNEDLKKQITGVESEYRSLTSDISVEFLEQVEELIPLPDGNYETLVEDGFLKSDKSQWGHSFYITHYKSYNTFRGRVPVSSWGGNANFHFPTKSYIGQAKNEQDGLTKAVQALRRYYERYPEYRTKAIEKYSRLKNLVPVLRGKQTDSRKELYKLELILSTAYVELYDFIDNTDKELKKVLSDTISDNEHYVVNYQKIKERAIKEGIDIASVRSNGGALAYLGRVVKLETTHHTYEGADYLFSTADGHSIYIVPEKFVRKASSKVNDRHAQAMHELFKNYDADHNDYEIHIHDAAEEPAGYAEKIWYISDKIIQAGDRKGKDNAYVHDFDTNKRPVYQLGEIIIIRNLQIDERGILN